MNTNILDPRDTYADASEWETKAKDLASRFIKNFSKYEGNEAGKGSGFCWSSAVNRTGISDFAGVASAAPCF